MVISISLKFDLI